MLFLPVLQFTIFLHNTVWLCIFSCSVGSQIYRYDRLSGPFQRQQTRWVVYGASLSMICILGLKLPTMIFPAWGPGSPYSLVAEAGFMLALLPMPLSISFAVMHSGLWNIDIIIKRTLIYALLTALLALVYAGCVALLQALFHAFIGQVSPLAIIGSTPSTPTTLNDAWTTSPRACAMRSTSLNSAQAC